MKQPNVNRKTLSLIQVIISIVLIIASVAACFAPLVKIETNDKLESISELIYEMDPEGELGIEMDDFYELDEVKVGFIQFVKIISLSTKISEAADDGDTQDLQELIKSDEGKEALLMGIAFASIFMDALEPLMEDGEESNISLGIILNLLVQLIALMGILIFTFTIPIIIFIKAFIAIIRALKNIKTPEKCAGKVGKTLPSVMTLPLTYMIAQTFVPGVNFAIGSILILVFALINVFVSATCARLREYSDEEFKYSVIVQGASLIGMIGYLVYFFNILKANIYKRFISGQSLDILTKEAMYEGKLDIPNAHIIGLVLILVTFSLILSSVKYLSKNANRFGHTMGSKKRLRDSAIVKAIFIALTYAFPIYIASGSYDYSNIGFGSKVKLLEFSSAEKSALTLSLVGIIIMLVAEIGLLVTRKIFAKNLTNEQMAAVVSGMSETPDEKMDSNEGDVEEPEQNDTEPEESNQ